ncbi:MAG: hypothetical protein C0448_10520 [Sphingobacteriaceae bacterium]|nr:hypothetical protein [Sphingobacteriaceae bacterium]
MIISFKIKNFRSFKDEVLFSMEADASKLKSQNLTEIELSSTNNIRLLKVAMAFGSNASGKTNLIRAFWTLINYIARKPKVNDRIWMYEPFLFDKESSKSNSEFEVVFIGPQNVKYIYQVVFNQKQIEFETLNYYPSGKITNLFTRSSKNDTDSNIHVGILGPSLSKKDKEINVFNNQLLLSKFGDDEPLEELTNVFLYFKKYEIINATNTKQRLDIERQVSAEVFNDISLMNKLNSLIRFADTKLKGFQVHNIKDEKISANIQNSLKEKLVANPYIVFGQHPIFNNSVDTGELHSLSFADESTGTQVLYAIGGKILMTLQNGGILIVDELDTSLHPFLTRMIILMFQSKSLNPKNAQLIFTSHDMTLLDRDLIRRDQVWIAEKNETGTSDMFSLQDFDGVREETPFDKWYLAGKFGGLPSIKSIDSMFDNESSSK